MRVILCILAGVLLSACSVGPVYKYPDIDLPDRYSLLAPVTKAAAGDLHWWLEFNDPVLNALVKEGLTENLTVAEARERVREAEAVLRRESVVPTGNATATARGNSNVPDTVSADLTANIGLAGRAQWASRGASQRLDAARLGVNETRRLLLSELTAAYIDLRFQQRSLETRQQDLVSRQRTLRELRTQLKAGAATRLDVLRAEALIAETRSEVPRISAGVVRQRNRISTLLGKPVGLLNVDLGYRGRQPHPRSQDAIQVPADLLRARPDIRIAERRYAAAVSDLGVAQASRYPSLSLSGLVTAPISTGSWNESIVAGLTIPVFSQPALAASADAARSRAQQAYLQWRRAVLTAVEEVENALASLQAAKRAVAASRELVSLNEKSLQLSRLLIVEGGEATVLDLIDRERSLSAARSELARGLRDLAVAYVELKVALGEGHEELADERTETAAEAATDTPTDEG